MSTAAPEVDRVSMSKADYAAALSAYWLLGVAASLRKRGFPKWLDRAEFFKQEETALAIARNANYRGPLVVYGLIDYVQHLSQTLTPPLKF